MRKLKAILIILASLVILVLGIAAIAPKKYAVECSITVQQPKDSVFKYVKHLKNQDNYSVWANMDPDIKKTYIGTDAGVGFISAWSSDNKDVGKGEQEITAIEKGKRIDYELRFMEPFETTDKAYIITESMNDSTTRVKWGFYGEMDYPMNLMLLFMDMEEILSGDLNKGLEKLKVILES